MFGYTLKINHINLETFMDFFLGFWELKTSKITLFSNLLIFYFAFWQNFAIGKKVDLEPFVDAEVRQGFFDMDCQLDLLFLCETASYEEINS
jgi:hypothetical protein